MPFGYPWFGFGYPGLGFGFGYPGFGFGYPGCCWNWGWGLNWLTLGALFVLI